jgi:hypothetical protein
MRLAKRVRNVRVARIYHDLRGTTRLSMLFDSRDGQFLFQGLDTSLADIPVQMRLEVRPRIALSSRFLAYAFDFEPHAQNKARVA